ncbi:GNAT family N-acetyltransferase [Microbacterium sp. X-17]|uniref:GNAT family N-acetyltransferase n=1 Tax=Microbacterium sp. X-17 TaxID=3144404 RepID=UPI0031F59184
MTDDTTVTRNDEASRYEIHVGGSFSGFSEFRIDARGRVVLPHTVIFPQFSGRGLGTVLISDMLGDLARRGETIVPWCPFVTRYLKDNDVAGLVVDWPDEADAMDAAAGGESTA